MELVSQSKLNKICTCDSWGGQTPSPQIKRGLNMEYGKGVARTREEFRRNGDRSPARGDEEGGNVFTRLKYIVERKGDLAVGG